MRTNKGLNKGFLGLFFMPKFKYRKGGIDMLSDEFLEKILAHEDSHKVPFGYQSTMIHVVDEILTEIREEKPYAELSELLSTDATATYDV